MQTYTVKELSDILRLTQSTIYRYLKEGKLPHMKIGRSFRMTSEQLDDFIKKCTINKL